MKTILCLSGGGTNGAWHPGVALGLADAAIEPDAYVGVSTGSLAAGYLGSRGVVAGAQGLGEIWKRLTSTTDFATSGTLRAIWRIVTGQPSLGTFAPLQRLLAANVADVFSRPTFVGVTSMATGEFRLKPPTRAAIEASCSVPPTTAPVLVDSEWCIDGGVRHVVPIGAAFDIARQLGWASETFRIVVSVAGSIPDPTGAVEYPAAWAASNLLATVERVVSILADGSSSADLADALRINALVRAGTAQPGQLSAPIVVLTNPIPGPSWTVDPARIAHQIDVGRNLTARALAA